MGINIGKLPSTFNAAGASLTISSSEVHTIGLILLCFFSGFAYFLEENQDSEVNGLILLPPFLRDER